jgi:hypothetical protein
LLVQDVFWIYDLLIALKRRVSFLKEVIQVIFSLFLIPSLAKIL